MDLTPVQEFYKGRSVLITGVTGFVGKALLEKLLRSCSDIRNIYLLVRPKKGEDIPTRLKKLLDDPLFNTVKNGTQNSVDRKVSLVQGDLTQAGLGMSAQSREELCREVSIVFHAAATIRFNENLKLALQTNVIGTQEVLNLCKEMPLLAAVVYVSTAFSHCPLEEVQEKTYPPPHDPRGISDTVKWLSETEFKAMEPTVLGQWPNTYCYTKALAEHVIKESRGDLPVAIFRPSIVISAWKDPIPGWIDNMNGPTKVILAASLGMVRSTYVDRSKVTDMVPVDMVVNAIIATAWETSSKRNEDTKVYNFVSNIQQPITWGGYLDACRDNVIKNPPSHAIWYYLLIACRNRYTFRATSFFLDFIPACLMDITPFVTAGTHKNVNDCCKYRNLMDLYSTFSTKEWKFHDANVRSLLRSLTSEDQEVFYFDLTQLKWKEYLENYVAGMRQFLLKENKNTLPAARKRYTV